MANAPHASTGGAELLPLLPLLTEPIVRAALAEDMPWGDLSAGLAVPVDATGRATMLAKAPGVIAGLPIAVQAWALLDPAVKVEVLVEDGMAVDAGVPIAVITGSARSILSGERVALNFVQRMSGVATRTRAFVEAVAGTKAEIVDTRKTTPGLRLLEKYAVRAGGGRNHRYALSDAVMIKDNHIVLAGGITAAVASVKRLAPLTTAIEVECETMAMVEEALAAGVDVIMLDNMAVEAMTEAVTWVAGRAKLEASGGVTLDTVRAIAETGVDYISVGGLTHSAPALDISLDAEV